jgi:hypothetical protein
MKQNVIKHIAAIVIGVCGFILAVMFGNIWVAIGMFCMIWGNNVEKSIKP